MSVLEVFFFLSPPRLLKRLQPNNNLKALVKTIPRRTSNCLTLPLPHLPVSVTAAFAYMSSPNLSIGAQDGTDHKTASLLAADKYHPSAMVTAVDACHILSLPVFSQIEEIC